MCPVTVAQYGPLMLSLATGVAADAVPANAATLPRATAARTVARTSLRSRVMGRPRVVFMVILSCGGRLVVLRPLAGQDDQQGDPAHPCLPRFALRGRYGMTPAADAASEPEARQSPRLLAEHD